MGLPDKFASVEHSRRVLARALVHLPGDKGPIPQIFEVAYDGAIWEVELRLKADKEIDRDFMESVPE